MNKFPLYLMCVASFCGSLSASAEIAKLSFESPASGCERPAVFKRAVAADDNLMTEVPGEVLRFARYTSGYYYNGARPVSINRDNIEALLSFDGDKVYYYNPISTYLGDTWIEGTVTQEGLRFEFPQPIAKVQYSTGSGAIIEEILYINRMQAVVDEDGVGYIPVDDEENFVLMKPNTEQGYGYANSFMSVPDPSTGILVQVPKWFLGVTYDDGGWIGEGSCSDSMVPFDYETVSVPEGLKTEAYMLPDRELGTAHTVGVAFDGDDVYFKGISRYLPEAWVKGKMVNPTTIELESYQFLGAVPGDGSYAWLSGGRMEKAQDDFGETFFRAIAEDVYKFDYAPELEAMSSVQTIMTTGGLGMEVVYEAYQQPELFIQGPITDYTPEAPVIIGWGEFNPDYGFGAIRFTVPTVNVYGQYLDTENLSYQMKVDGEPYEFKPSSSILPGGAATTFWIPFDFSDYDLTSEGVNKALYYYFEGEHNLSVQSRYVDPETGKEWLSEISDNGYNSVAEIAGESEIAGETWYDLRGVASVGRPEGPAIKVVSFKDGTRKAYKIR